MSAQPNSTHSKHILVIDNEIYIQEVAKICLETITNWQITTASSGAEGIIQAIQCPPDAILLDVMMPEMDGPTTFVKLQANPATQAIPVILLTAKVQALDLQRYAELGVQGAIAKPFDPLTLAQQITNTLGWDPE